MSNTLQKTSSQQFVANGRKATYTRSLYIAKAGQTYAAWLDDYPPPPTITKQGGQKFPPFRPPDFWHDRAWESAEDVAHSLRASGLIKQPVRVNEIDPAWAAEGFRRGVATTKKERAKRPDPATGGLFAPEHVAPCEPHPGDTEHARLRERYTVRPKAATVDPMLAPAKALRGGS